jgi:glycosyltransferase involved in cell wall biosynthesis
MKPAKGGIVAIFWGPHSRHTEDIARRLGATPYAVDALSWSWRKHSWVAPIKYVIQAFRTWALLLRTRPAAVYVIIPPTFSALAVWMYCVIARIPFVMDVHGHSLTSRKWGWTAPLQHFLAHRAVATVVDQRKYVQAFEARGARTVMLERTPVEIPASRLKKLNHPGAFSVLMVNIFGADEPTDLVVEAARQLPDVTFFITGEVSKAPEGMVAGAPKNVVFTGYLKGDDYWHHLYSAGAVMTLTTEAYSLVSGGIEAMALGRPNILSRQPVLEEYFTKGTVFVDHTVESLVAGVRAAQASEEVLSQQALQLATEKRERWDRALRDLLGYITDAARKPIALLNEKHRP